MAVMRAITVYDDAVITIKQGQEFSLGDCQPVKDVKSRDCIIQGDLSYSLVGMPQIKLKDSSMILLGKELVTSYVFDASKTSYGYF